MVWSNKVPMVRLLGDEREELVIRWARWHRRSNHGVQGLKHFFSSELIPWDGGCIIAAVLCSGRPRPYHVSVSN